MGASTSKFCDSIFGKKETKVLMLGLDAAGKTTMLYRMKTIENNPLIRYNVESADYNGLNFISWDLGGQEKLRLLWKHYYVDAKALVFVVDCTDRDRIDEVKEELRRLLEEEELKSIPLLVFANKQDRDGRMSVEEITEKLDLNALTGREWHIEGTCAVTNEGIYEGLEWLSKTLNKKW